MNTAKDHIQRFDDVVYMDVHGDGETFTFEDFEKEVDLRDGREHLVMAWMDGRAFFTIVDGKDDTDMIKTFRKYNKHNDYYVHYGAFSDDSELVALFYDFYEERIRELVESDDKMDAGTVT